MGWVITVGDWGSSFEAARVTRAGDVSSPERRQSCCSCRHIEGEMNAQSGVPPGGTERGGLEDVATDWKL